jgi:alpha-1,6-mannosyltransferase
LKQRDLSPSACEPCPPGERRKWSRKGLLPVTLGLSALAYAYTGFHLTNLPGAAGVHAFLLLFAWLFLLYVMAVRTLATQHFCIQPGCVAALVVLVGTGFRLLVLPAGIPDGITPAKLHADLTGKEVVFNRFLLYDHDLWRFLWDGHQQALGLNPYQYPPACFLEPDDALEWGLTSVPAAERARLLPNDHWRDIHAHINHPDLPTVYPPGLQLLFRLSYTLFPGSVVGWKLCLLLLDLGVMALLWLTLTHFDQPPWKLALYAWSPLVIKEGVGTGHADALVAFMLLGLTLALARARPAAIGIWLAAATLTKLAPLLLLPFAVRHLRWAGSCAFGLTLATGLWPFRHGEVAWAGLAAYTQHWTFNPGFSELCHGLLHLSGLPLNHAVLARTISGGVFLTLLFLYRRQLPLTPRSAPETLLCVLGGLFFFSPTVMPWYFIWIIPLAALTGQWSWLLYGGLSVLSYLIYADSDGRESATRLLLIHGSFCVAWFIERHRVRSRTTPNIT